MKQIKEILMNVINQLYTTEQIDLLQSNYLHCLVNNEFIKPSPTGVYFQNSLYHINYSHSHRALRLLIQNLSRGGEFLCMEQSKLNL
jgi:hypothetical protein